MFILQICSIVSKKYDVQTFENGFPPFLEHSILLFHSQNNYAVLTCRIAYFLVKITHNLEYFNLTAVLGKFSCGFSVFAEILSGFAVFTEILSGFAVLGTPLTPPPKKGKLGK